MKPYISLTTHCNVCSNWRGLLAKYLSDYGHFLEVSTALCKLQRRTWQLPWSLSESYISLWLSSKSPFLSVARLLITKQLSNVWSFTFKLFHFCYRNNIIWTNTTGDVFQVVITGLQPYTYYTIKVCTLKRELRRPIIFRLVYS